MHVGARPSHCSAMTGDGTGNGVRSVGGIDGGRVVAWDDEMDGVLLPKLSLCPCETQSRIT